MAKDTTKEVDRLEVKIDNLNVTELQGFTTGEEDTFLREDGTFAEPKPTMAQVLMRISLRS